MVKCKKRLKLVMLLSLLGGMFLLTACQVNTGENTVEEATVPPQQVSDEATPAVEEPDGSQSETLPTPRPEPALLSPNGSTPTERYGVLQIKDGQLCDELGNPVQLRGMSSFGLQWGDGFWVLTDEAFDVLADDWECDIIRLAMYVAEGGYSESPSLILERLERGIELATERGMYVMIDWHMLNPGDPTDDIYLTAGLNDPNMPDEFLALRDANPEWNGPQVFFAYIAQKYNHQYNLLYEPANEPNRIGDYGKRFEVWSDTLKPYFESVIEVIRLYDDTGIIICGTDNWSQFVDAPVKDPIDDPNVMYAMHFYSGTHDAGYDPTPGNPDTTGDYWLRGMTDAALDGGLAVFCTEWGSSTASGNGGPYIDFALRWTEYMEERNISWCAWSMAQKNETSAAFNKSTSPTPDGVWPDDEVSVAGRFYRAMIKGDPVPMYTEDGEVAQNPEDGVHNGDIVYVK